MTISLDFFCIWTPLTPCEVPKASLQIREAILSCDSFFQVKRSSKEDTVSDHSCAFIQAKLERSAPFCLRDCKASLEVLDDSLPNVKLEYLRAFLN